MVEMPQGSDLCHSPLLVLLGHGNKAAQGTWKSSLQQQVSPRPLFPRSSVVWDARPGLPRIPACCSAAVLSTCSGGGVG